MAITISWKLSLVSDSGKQQLTMFIQYLVPIFLGRCSEDVKASQNTPTPGILDIPEENNNGILKSNWVSCCGAERETEATSTFQVIFLPMDLLWDTREPPLR